MKSMKDRSSRERIAYRDGLQLKKKKDFKDSCIESRKVGLGTTVEYIERKFKTKA